MVLSHFPAVRHLIALAVNILEKSKPWGKGGLGDIPQTEGSGHTRMGGPSTEKEEGGASICLLTIQTKIRQTDVLLDTYVASRSTASFL